MRDNERVLAKQFHPTRRHFFKAGAGGLAAAMMLSGLRQGKAADALEARDASPELASALARLDSYLTADADFTDVSRGDPIPHSLADERKAAVGLTRDTWRLEVISDPEHPVPMRNPLTKEKNNSLDFAALMKLAETHAVRFAKVMTCLNIGTPLGMGIWEGVPLRDVIWLTEPREELRRVFYYGYHNDKPEQMFKSSLPISRVLEDPFDLPPVILCYKLNGRWLSSQRGGPVRIVVPEGYGFKCVKWITHVVLTNLPHANDTYAEQGNDIDSPLKTFANTLNVPREFAAGQGIPLSGYAQVGIGGLSRVQVWFQAEGEQLAGGDRFFSTAPWVDMQILPPPAKWGGGLPDDRIPAGTIGFDSATGKPHAWPLRLVKVHWAGIHPPLSPGKYTLRTRAVDAKGIGQPMPRPLRKQGHSAIEQISVVVKD